MENYTLYTHQTDLSVIEALFTRLLPKAKVSVSEPEPGHVSYAATLKGGFFSKAKTLTINVQYRPTPDYKLTEVTDGFTQNLAGMTNFVQGISAEHPGITQLLAMKIGSVNAQLAFMAGPGLSADIEKLLRELTIDLDALVFSVPGQTLSRSNSQHFMNSKFQLLLDMEGNGDVDQLDMKVDAKYHERTRVTATEQQTTRKEKSIAELEKIGIPVLQTLPVVADDQSVELRDKANVIDRAYALLLVAAKGGGLPQEQVDATAKQRELKFSPRESVFIGEQNPADDAKNTFTWRYESVGLLTWALGLVDELPFAADMVDVGELVPILMKTNKEQLLESTTLRSKVEILDRLDLIYRMHWACVNARIKGESPEPLHPGVVYERYYALNWLTGQGGEDWDNIDTPS